MRFQKTNERQTNAGRMLSAAEKGMPEAPNPPLPRFIVHTNEGLDGIGTVDAVQAVDAHSTTLLLQNLKQNISG